MSSDIAICVENLGKIYHLYDKPRDRLKQFVMPSLRRWLKKPEKHYFREFTALQDVSFSVKRGESIGVIGRNGSGKSTLLQMICGTLTPSGGSIQTYGRVAALLELGAGFNPEFTGRENVYMNAAILGLSLEEISARFEAIAAFADIGEFMEQPVKTYSSGMYVRLAFAVVAHVDADILVVDEALSVGDAVFTQKCMRFIRQFQRKGTLIFVSHDIASVQNLCHSVLWLNKGKVEGYGAAKKIAEAYLQYTLQEQYGEEAALSTIQSADDGDTFSDVNVEPVIHYGAEAKVRDNLQQAKGWKTEDVSIISVNLSRLSPGSSSVFVGGERVRMSIKAKAYAALPNPIVGFLVRDRLGQDLFGENTLAFSEKVATPVAAGETFEGVFEFRLPMLPNGVYAVMVSIADGDVYENVQHHWLHDALIINVSSSKVRYGLVGIPFERVVLEVIHE
ncbi:lipopolysaccharide transport system ATP-binding protein [Thiothrix caldifontis]|jgi:ABC-type polysaccharide/polyol phosphate transport system, ATPase component|uniref:Lipopolysaccharide transport system ATP-binding protein n=1 Tax=Thiothrix caldifontis TaxID=525918 RepID=A0A1H3VWI0_9GAMM|nr:ABC transporter ATP-binding protein [Thiothrix caldifontis]SDZ78452.1 lipopolysaccharide transport system ATP-binding protein [Thiothrix caldifontis]